MYVYIYIYIYISTTDQVLKYIYIYILYIYILYIYIYIYISYTYRHIVKVTCLTSGQTTIKTKQSEVDGKIFQNMKRPFLPQCLNATKHLGKIRLHMVSKLFC